MILKANVEPSMEFEKQIETLVLNTTEKAIEKFYTKIATKEWMSIKEACKYANVSNVTFQKFRTLGLRIAEIDGIKRVSKKEIDRFLETNSY